LFAYPAPTKTPKKEAVTSVATAVLSTTVKVKAREKKKAAERDLMDTVIIFIFRAELGLNL
jgi:26S proteasome regulatory subunit N2